MKKKLLVLVAMLLCVVTVLASCASSMKFEKVVGDGTYNDENPTLTTAEKLDVKGEYDSTLSRVDLAVFVDTSIETLLSTYTVYNVATGATVLGPLSETKTESGANSTTVRYSIVVMDQWDTNWFKVTTTTTTVTVDETTGTDTDVKMDLKYYTAAGTEFAAILDYNSADLAAAWTVEDLICLDGKVYRIAEDGTIAHAFDWSELRGKPGTGMYRMLHTGMEKVGEYYFNKIEGGFAILDAQLNTVVVYNTPYYIGLSEEMDVEPYCLANGNVLVQYVVMLDVMAEEYDLIMMGTKLDLRTVLVDAEKGKVKELDLDYMIEDIEYKEYNDDYWFYGEKVENVAIISYLEDGQLDMNSANWKLVALGNDGKVDGVIDDLIPNMDNNGLWHVATNRWIAGNKMGQSFLLNEKGDILGEVTGINEEEMNASFFILNNKIYDWDLAVKYDMTENKIAYYEEMNHSILMVNEDGETLLYANGTATTLIAKDVENKNAMPLPIGVDDDDDPIYSGEGFVITTVTDDKIKYDFYNDMGTIVLTLENVDFDEDLYVCSADSTNAFMIVATTIPAEGETAKTVYYRFG